MNRTPGKAAVQLGVIYAIIAFVWIYCSDRLLLHLVPNPVASASWQTIKGLVFVSATAVLVGRLFWQNLRRLQTTDTALIFLERRYRMLFERNPQAICVLRAASLEFLALNDAAIAHFGYSQYELMKMSLLQVSIGEGVASLRQEDKTANSAGSVSSMEWQHRRRDDALVDVHVTWSRIDYLDQPALLIVVNDITERKRGEQALESSLALLHGTLQSTADGILAVNLSGQIQSYNERFRLMWGIPKGVIDTGDNRQSLAFAAEQLKDPEGFLAGVQRLYAQPGDIMVDLMEFKDGRIFERRSGPQWVRGQYAGRVSSFRDVTEQRRAEARLKESEETLRDYAGRLQRMSRRLLEAQEVERRHLARELHDQVGQSLTSVEINLQATQQAGISPQLAPRLEESLKTIALIQEQVRELSFELRPSLLDDVGLAAALRWYTNDQARRAGFRARFVADPLPTRLSTALETACFRVAQEALTNVVRHAQATEVIVELKRHDGWLEMVVRDNGVGFDPEAVRSRAAEGEGLGLLGMQERASLAGGRLECKSAPAAGTEISVLFNLSEAAPDASAEREQRCV